MFWFPIDFRKVVFVNNLGRVHWAPVIAVMTSCNVGQPGVSIDKGGLDLKNRLIWHAMAVDDMDNFQPTSADIVNSLNLGAGLILSGFERQGGVYVGKDSVSSPLANIERFPVAWVDQTVNVIP